MKSTVLTATVPAVLALAAWSCGGVGRPDHQGAAGAGEQASDDSDAHRARGEWRLMSMQTGRRRLAPGHRLPALRPLCQHHAARRTGRRRPRRPCAANRRGCLHRQGPPAGGEFEYVGLSESVGRERLTPDAVAMGEWRYFEVSARRCASSCATAPAGPPRRSCSSADGAAVRGWTARSRPRQTLRWTTRSSTARWPPAAGRRRVACCDCSGSPKARQWRRADPAWRESADPFVEVRANCWPTSPATHTFDVPSTPAARRSSAGSGRAAGHPLRRDHQLRRACAADRQRQRGARRGPGQRRQSHLDHHPLPSGDRRQRVAHRLRRRPAGQTGAAGARAGARRPAVARSPGLEGGSRRSWDAAVRK